MDQERPILSLKELEEYDEGQVGNGGQHRYCCPLPACSDKPVDSSHRSLAVDTESGAWMCHRCQHSGKLREFWVQATDSSGNRQQVIPAAFRFDSLTAGVVNASTPDNAEATRRLQGHREIRDSSAARRYMNGRGIPLQTAEPALAVFHTSFHGSPAILFPILGASGNLVAVHGRYIESDVLPKARSDGKLGDGVFETLEGVYDQEIVFVAEAPFDALSCATVGYHGIALCGLRKPPTWLLDKLTWKTVVLAFDSDEPGDKAAREWASALETVGAESLRLSPSRKDCNEVLVKDGSDRLTEEIEAVLSGREYVFRTVLKEPDVPHDTSRLPMFDEVGVVSEEAEDPSTTSRVELVTPYMMVNGIPISHLADDPEYGPAWEILFTLNLWNLPERDCCRDGCWRGAEYPDSLEVFCRDCWESDGSRLSDEEIERLWNIEKAKEAESYRLGVQDHVDQILRPLWEQVVRS